jgi:hypothetical protein
MKECMCSFLFLNPSRIERELSSSGPGYFTPEEEPLIKIDPGWAFVSLQTLAAT